MRLTTEQQQTVQQLAARFPLPTTEEGCQAWTRRVAEQFCFSFGSMWGHKSAGDGRPPSKDAMAYLTPSTFLAFDLIVGAGSGSPQLVMDPEPIDITGQVFIPVSPINHLKLPPPDPTPTPGTLEEKVDELLRRMAAVEGAVTEIREHFR